MSYQQELDTLLNKEASTWETLDYTKLYNLMKSTISPKKANVPLLLEIHDNFGGTQNYPPLNLFVATILGTCGYPTLVLGSEQHSDGKSVQHYQVLKEAGLSQYPSVDEIITRLEDPDIAWAYADYSTIQSPALADIMMQAKRKIDNSLLTELESMLQPIAADKQFIVGQYRYYKNRTRCKAILEDHTTFDKAILVNGMEGSCMVNPTAPSESIKFQGNKAEDILLYGVQKGFALLPKYINDLSPNDVNTIGQLLLDGESLPVRKFVQYQCVYILNELFGVSVEDALYQIRQAIDTGMAKSNWERFFDPI